MFQALILANLHVRQEGIVFLTVITRRQNFVTWEDVLLEHLLHVLLLQIRCFATQSHQQKNRLQVNYRLAGVFEQANCPTGMELANVQICFHLKSVSRAQQENIRTKWDRHKHA
jgi:hypothetical protein